MSSSLVSALSSHTHARLQLVFKLLQTHTDTHIDTHFNHILQLNNIQYSQQFFSLTRMSSSIICWLVVCQSGTPSSSLGLLCPTEMKLSVVLLI